MLMTETSTSAKVEGLGLSACAPSCVVLGAQGKGESLLGEEEVVKKWFAADEDCGGCEAGDFVSLGSSPYFQLMYVSTMPLIRVSSFDGSQ